LTSASIIPKISQVDFQSLTYPIEAVDSLAGVAASNYLEQFYTHQTLVVNQIIVLIQAVK